MGCDASVELRGQPESLQQKTPLYNLSKALQKRKKLSKRFKDGLENMKTSEDVKQDPNQPKFYKKFSAKNKIQREQSQAEIYEYKNDPEYHLSLEEVNFKELIESIFRKNETIDWIDVKAQIKDKYDIKSLKIVFKLLLEKIIQSNIKEVNTNRISMKQCKLKVAELMLNYAIQALIFVINYPEKQTAKLIYNFENEGFILTLKFLPQLQKFYKELSIFLKTKYPRSENIDAGQLGRKFQQFDCTSTLDYDIIAQSGIIFKTSKQLSFKQKEFQQRTYTDDFELINTIKILINKLIDETDNYYKYFPELIQEIATIDKTKQKKQYYQYKVGRKISENTARFKQLDTGTIQIKSPDISRVLVKWMEYLQQAVLQPEIIFSVQNLQSNDKIQIKKIALQKIQDYSNIDEINKLNNPNQTSSKNNNCQNKQNKNQRYEKCSQKQFEKIHDQLIKKIKQKVNQKNKRKITQQQLQILIKQMGLNQQKQKNQAKKKIRRQNYYEQYYNYLNQFSVDLVRILIEGNLSQKEVSRQQMQMIKYAFSVNNLINWTIEERIIKAISILIQSAQSIKLPDQQILNLINFKVNDLLRCQFFGNRKDIETIYQRIINLQKKQIYSAKQIRIIKIKNRFDTPMSDAVIYFKFRDCFLICECQLILSQNKNNYQQIKKQKNIQEFNHFLYELERSPFGVLGQLSMFLKKNSETVSTYNQKIKLTLRKQKKTIIQESVKQKYRLIHRENRKQNFQKLLFQLQDDYKKINQKVNKIIEPKDKNDYQYQQNSKQYAKFKCTLESFQQLKIRNEINNLMNVLQSRLRKPFICSYCFQYMKKFSCQRIHTSHQCGINVCSMCIEYILETQRKNLIQFTIFKQNSNTSHQEQKKNDQEGNSNKLKNKQENLIPQQIIKNLRYHYLTSFYENKNKEYIRLICNEDNGFDLNKIFKLIQKDQWLQSDRKQKSQILVKASKLMAYFNKTQDRAISKNWKIYFVIYSRIGKKTKFSLFKYIFYEGLIENVYNKAEKYLRHEFIELHPSSQIFTFSTLNRITILDDSKMDDNINQLKKQIQNMIFIFDYQNKYLKNREEISNSLTKSKSSNTNENKEKLQNKFFYFSLYQKDKKYSQNKLEILVDIDKNQRNETTKNVQQELKNLSQIQNRKKNIELSDRGIKQSDIAFFKQLKLFLQNKKVQKQKQADRVKDHQNNNKAGKPTQKKNNKNTVNNTTADISPINDLTKFQWLENIKTLNLSKNKLEEIEIILQACIHLQHFDASQNNIKNVKIQKQLKSIESLNFSKNKIQQITTKQKTKIKDMMPRIQSINLSFNPFPSQKKKTEMLELIKKFKLKQISLDGINLSDLQLVSLIKVEKEPQNNIIKDQIQIISLNLNLLTKLPNLTEIKQYKKLKQIYISFNPIDIVDQQKNQAVNIQGIKQQKKTINLKELYNYKNQKQEQINFLSPSLTQMENQQFYKHYLEFDNSKLKLWKKQPKPQTTNESSIEKAQINNYQIKNARSLYLRHIFSSEQQVNQRYNKCQKWKQSLQYPNEKYHLYLDHSFVNLDGYQFVRFDWSRLSVLNLKCCYIHNKQWQILVKNADKFQNLKSINLDDNYIQSVTLQELDKFKILVFSYWNNNCLNDTSVLDDYNNRNFKQNIYEKLAIYDYQLRDKIVKAWKGQGSAKVNTESVTQKIRWKIYFLRNFKSSSQKKCKNKHPMRYMYGPLTRYSLFKNCQFCSKPVNNVSNVFWCCQGCSFNICSGCGGYQKYTCAYGHTLVYEKKYKSRSIRCDICWSKPIQQGWHCECDFDICTKCLKKDQQKKSPATNTSQQNQDQQNQCRKGHPMRYMSSLRTQQSNWRSCDLCDIQIGQNSNVYWSCSRCDYDLCYECGGFKKTVCVFRHPLKSKQFQQKSNVQCDICHAQNIKSASHCDCNFNICKGCYNPIENNQKAEQKKVE